MSFDKEALTELRAIRVAIHTLTKVVQGDESPEVSCPQCLISDPEKIVATPVMGVRDRKSCLSCGHSWRNDIG